MNAPARPINPFVINLLALLAGCLLPLAFAPVGWFPLAVICPAILLWLWLSSTPKLALLCGWLFGLGYFGVGVSWVFVSIHQFGNTNAILAALLTLLFVGTLALFPALQGYCLTQFFPKNNASKLLLAFPSIWVLLEALRSWFLTGFPWLFLGASQTASPLRGYAPLIGEYGISFLVALSSALIVVILVGKNQRYKALLGLLLIWIGGGLLTFLHWTKPLGNPIEISLVQGNIPQQIKWTANFVQPTLQRYYQLTQAHWHSKIITWPEAAIPLLQQDAQPFLQRLDQQTKNHHSTLIVGIPIQQGFSYYNALMTLGNGHGVYYKRHLVPFGEYLPLEHLLRGLIGFFAIPMSDFSAGPWQQPALTANGIHIAPFICYEIAYTHLVLSSARSANLLIVLSDDAWFGKSFAAEQHLQIAQMRALETARPILFNANNGVTAIINAQGKIQARLPRFQADVLTDLVQPMQGHTPLMYSSVAIIVILMIILLFISVWRQK